MFSRTKPHPGLSEITRNTKQNSLFFLSLILHNKDASEVVNYAHLSDIDHASQLRFVKCGLVLLIFAKIQPRSGRRSTEIVICVTLSSEKITQTCWSCKIDVVLLNRLRQFSCRNVICGWIKDFMYFIKIAEMISVFICTCSTLN